MSNLYYKLVGYARPIPDVATFVTPVFIDKKRTYYIQVVQNDRIIDFQMTNLGEEYIDLNETIAKAIVGDSAIYGFESPDKFALIGSPHLLASILLQVKISLVQGRGDVSYSCTGKAIDRFIKDYKDESPSKSQSPFLYFLDLTDKSKISPVPIVRDIPKSLLSVFSQFEKTLKQSDKIQSRQIIKQMIEFNQATFNNAFDAMVLLQDQFERIAATALDQATWLPAEGRKAIESWVGALKKDRGNYINFIDENYEIVENFFQSQRKKPKPSSK